MDNKFVHKKDHAGKSQLKPNKPSKVLVIDDLKDLASVMCELIRLLGHEAEFALNGMDGIAKAKETRPGVIICDIGLPGISGYEVAGLIRKDDELRDTLLIALSGYVPAGRHEALERSGF